MTDDAKYELAAIGNALVDVLAHASDAFLVAEGMAKGNMTLIDENRAQSVYDKMPAAVESSGGSAANTLAGFASLGGKAAFMGKVADDQLGKVFIHDLKAQGVHYGTAPLQNGPETGRCLILVTPDAQRTMNTFLGASVELGPDDVNEDIIKQSKIVYLEGYLFDKPEAKEAFRRSAKIANEAGRKIALTLSDGFCVDRHRDDFRALVEDHVDILFANEEEIMSLYEVDDFEDAVAAVRSHCGLVVITRGSKGSVVLEGDNRYDVAAAPLKELVDTTGAGDAFAAGFLYGHVKGWDLEECAKLGSKAASEVISHMGPRPDGNLQHLLAA